MPRARPGSAFELNVMEELHFLSRKQSTKQCSVTTEGWLEQQMMRYHHPSKHVSLGPLCGISLGTAGMDLG